MQCYGGRRVVCLTIISLHNNFFLFTSTSKYEVFLSVNLRVSLFLYATRFSLQQGRIGVKFDMKIPTSQLCVFGVTMTGTWWRAPAFT